MALNVNRSIHDAFYRYKMPRLVAKVEGKGNGVKTVIVNMTEIARSLGRPPSYCTKYFGCELGAQTQFDLKNERYIVNGSHEAAKLQDMLDGFIKKFVLCEECENPETVIKANTRKGLLVATCKACGHSFQLDMRHKLTTFILKNCPENAAAEDKKDKRKDKKSKKGSNAGNNENESSNGNNESSPNNHDTSNQDAADDDWADDDDDEDWGVDMSDAAIKQRSKELTSGICNLTMNDDLEKAEVDRINIFHKFVKARLDTIDQVAVEKEVLGEANRLEVQNKAPIILCELLLENEDATVLKAIKKHKRLFLRFTHQNQKAQKYLIGGIEKTIEQKKDSLLPKVAGIFKTFYDEDILEEEVIIDWAKKVSKKYVSKDLAEQIHKKANPFITWLKEAEEETSDEDESDVELEFDEKAKISSIKEKKEEKPSSKESTPSNATNTNGAGGDDDEEDDVDIDDI